jgi:hypothetical protein
MMGLIAIHVIGVGVPLLLAVRLFWKYTNAFTTALREICGTKQFSQPVTDYVIGCRTEIPHQINRQEEMARPERLIQIAFGRSSPLRGAFGV